jgi:large subunit ribosomal protein L22
MLATATLRHGRIAPRKVRIVARLIQGKPVAQAINMLLFTNRAAAPMLKKLLISAIANAEDKSKGSVATDNLVVKEVAVNGGPKTKRWRPRAMGRATRVDKRTSHICITLDDGMA